MKKYARLAGVHPNTIIGWEKGKSRPRKEQLAVLVSLRGIGKREAMTLEGASFSFKVPSVAGTFAGTWDESAFAIEGTWKQGPVELPLRFERSSEEEIKPPNRPQEPRPPFPYRVEEVSYTNESETEIKFAATLTLPEGEGPFPAVVLITGSGPQNRDEELMGHKPFLVIADHLTRLGVAVLRADDRGVGGSTGNVNSATSEDFAGDALAGVAYLKSHSEIDGSKIGLIGHSEGGLVAPIAAALSDDVAFIVLLAGTGVSGAEVITLQGEALARARGGTEEEIEVSVRANKRIYELIESGRDEGEIREEAAKVVEALRESFSENDSDFAEGSLEMIEAQLDAVLTPWFRFFFAYDPTEALRRVTCPVLVLNGELDLQVIPSQNLPPIVAALEEAGNPDYTVIKFPGLNHLFQTCETGSPSEYAQIEETMNPDVLEAIANWIGARVGLD